MDLRHRRAAIGLAAAAVDLVAIASQIYAESLENEEDYSDGDERFGTSPYCCAGHVFT
jgi:hypothetical protein